MFSQWKWSVSKFFKLQSIFTSWKAQVSMTNKVITFIEQGREEEEEEEERERERESTRNENCRYFERIVLFIPLLSN